MRPLHQKLPKHQTSSAQVTRAQGFTPSLPYNLWACVLALFNSEGEAENPCFRHSLPRRQAGARNPSFRASGLFPNSILTKNIKMPSDSAWCRPKTATSSVAALAVLNHRIQCGGRGTRTPKSLRTAVFKTAALPIRRSPP